MSDKTRIGILLVLGWIFAILAVSTMLPFSASKTNDLGYYSLCSFAPWSALALLLVAGVLFAIRKYLLTRIQ
jgi:MprA protease rhombosortase-interaction domain-containing protein